MNKFTYKTDLEEMLEYEIIAIDLGYSCKNASCGIATTVNIKLDECTFSDCLEKVSNLISTATKDTLLILEAPLSSCHMQGNPSGRHGAKRFCESKQQTCFEKQGSRTRYWYYGAGATTYLSAHRFLTQLSKLIPHYNYKVYLSEAFLSFKKEGTPHGLDARYILKYWDYKKTLTPVNCERSVPSLMDGIPSVQIFNPNNVK